MQHNRRRNFSVAVLFAILTACGSAPPPPPEEPMDTEPGEEEKMKALEQALIQEINQNIAYFFTLMESDDPRVGLSNTHIGKFIQLLYEKQSPQMQTVLRDIDLEIQFDTKEQLGINMSLLECIARCDQGDPKACDFVTNVFKRYADRKDEIQDAVQWFGNPELAHRYLAHLIFGRVMEYGIGDIYVEDKTFFTHVAIHCVKENSERKEHWIFAMQYYHDFWHIVGVDPVDAKKMNTTSPPRSQSEIGI